MKKILNDVFDVEVPSWEYCRLRRVQWKNCQMDLKKITNTSRLSNFGKSKSFRLVRQKFHDKEKCIPVTKISDFWSWFSCNYLLAQMKYFLLQLATGAQFQISNMIGNSCVLDDKNDWWILLIKCMDVTEVKWSFWVKATLLCSLSNFQWGTRSNHCLFYDFILHYLQTHKKQTTLRSKSPLRCSIFFIKIKIRLSWFKMSGSC